MSQLGTMQGGRVEPGRALMMQFDLLAKLGAGGLGDLYRAQDRASGQVLAVRATEIPDAPAALDAFGSVIALHNRLAQLPIARVRSCGGAERCLWYGMDYLDGESLHSLVLYRSRPSLPEAVRLVIEATDTVAALHAENVIHQDLSPRNLFVDNGKLRILELGIAPAVARLIREKPGLITTPRLRASEQLVAAQADPRTDLYALGAVLFFLLTGRRAISKGPQVLQLATEGGVAPPKLDEVPDGIRPTLQRALAMRPDDRYSSAIEFAAALRRVST